MTDYEAISIAKKYEVYKLMYFIDAAGIPLADAVDFLLLIYDENYTEVIKMAVQQQNLQKRVEEKSNTKIE